MKRLMATGRHTNLLRRSAMVLACVPLLTTLTGCPANDPLAGSGAPGKTPAAATAPAAQQTTPAQQAAQQKEAAAQAAANQHAQQVQNLINKAEASYSSGVANYNANRLDAARQDFDFAVDAMLSSGMDLKNDPQLSDEFERLLSAINSLELVALKQGNGFSPKVEAAPIDIAANEATFPVDPNLAKSAEAELKTTVSDFPLVVNDEVAFWISYFTNSPSGHAHLKASLQRAGKYKEMILRILKEQGVPQDLIYQAITESGFQPQVVNARSGAGGMWQFMPFAESYSLTRNGYFDERFDPEKSTIAYAKYMKMLYGLFGDWYLAMAAYDWGPGRVQHVVSRTGYADYWQMSRHGNLPAETKAYIPGVIASIIMAKNPDRYGLTNLTPDPPVLYDTVTTNYSIDMRLVADLTGSSVQEVVALNPALLRLATPRDISYDLHLPTGTKDLYLERLKDVPESNRASWRFHIVKDGETLDGIAAAFHAKPAEIASFNDVSASQQIEGGDELIIPIAAVATANIGQQHYTTRRGDSLVTVADRFGVTVEQLRTWNHLTTNNVTVGKMLYVAEPVRLAPGSRGARRARGAATAASNRGKTTAHTTAKPAAHSSAPAANTSKPSANTSKPSAHSSTPAAKSAHTTTKKKTTK